MCFKNTLIEKVEAWQCTASIIILCGVQNTAERSQPAVLQGLWNQIRIITTGQNYEIIEMYVIPGHVHLFVRCDPFGSPINRLKNSRQSRLRTFAVSRVEAEIMARCVVGFVLCWHGGHVVAQIAGTSVNKAIHPPDLSVVFSPRLINSLICFEARLFFLVLSVFSVKKRLSCKRQICCVPYSVKRVPCLSLPCVNCSQNVLAALYVGKLVFD